MTKENILVVDDEENILELLDYNLTKAGYNPLCVNSGEEALKKIREENLDLILLDLMLPGIDGLDVCKIIKSDPVAAYIPIIMLTARGEEADVVVGLELGADDYVTKPFSPRVLIARIKAILRRQGQSQEHDENVIRFPSLLIDQNRHEVKVDNEIANLTYSEFGILVLLAGRPGRVYTRNQIIDRVRGGDYPVTDRSVDVQIVGLRKKLGSQGGYIETVRGVGYRFKDI